MGTRVVADQLPPGARLISAMACGFPHPCGSGIGGALLAGNSSPPDCVSRRVCVAHDRVGTKAYVAPRSGQASKSEGNSSADTTRTSACLAAVRSSTPSISLPVKVSLPIAFFRLALSRRMRLVTLQTTEQIFPPEEVGCRRYRGFQLRTACSAGNLHNDLKSSTQRRPPSPSRRAPANTRNIPRCG